MKTSTRYAIRYTLYGALAMLCIACAQKGEECTLSVTAVDKATGLALAGVAVSVDGKSLGETGEDGVCRGTLKLPYGKHNLSCSKQGFRKRDLVMDFLPQEKAEESGFSSEPSLLDEIGELAAEFDYRVELETEE